MTFTSYANLTFKFDRRHRLVRESVPKGNHQQPYSQTCTKSIFEEVCFAIEKLGTEALSIAEIIITADPTYLPSTQVAIALQFLEERGIIDIDGRFRYAQTNDVHLNGMTEWTALEHSQIGEA